MMYFKQTQIYIDAQPGRCIVKIELLYGVTHSQYDELLGIQMRKFAKKK